MHDRHINPRRPSKKLGLLAFLAFSTGLSVSIVYYLYKLAKPVEVSWRVFEDLLARGEVQSIQVSQSREMAIVVLQSPQYVDGKPVFVSFIVCTLAFAFDIT